MAIATIILRFPEGVIMLEGDSDLLDKLNDYIFAEEEYLDYSYEHMNMDKVISYEFSSSKHPDNCLSVFEQIIAA